MLENTESLHRRVVRRTQQEGVGLQRYEILLPQGIPFRILAEGVPDLLAVCAIAICEHPDERIRIVEALPDTEDFRAMLGEQGDLLLAEPLVQFVDPALELTDAVTARVRRVHPDLEAARVRRDVPGEILRKRRLGSARLGRLCRRTLSAPALLSGLDTSG